MSICYENLCIQKLGAGLTISNFIKGIGPYTYENYLLKFVNHSPFFSVNPTETSITILKRKHLAKMTVSQPIIK